MNIHTAGKAVALEDAETRYNEAVTHVVRQLQTLAHDISKERLGDSQNLSPEDTIRCAYRIIQAVTWGVANAHLDDVVIAASRVEQVRNR